MHESIIQGLLFFCGFASILTTLGIVIVLGNESITLFTGGDVSIVEFFTSTDWNPAIGHFGVLPLLNATVITSATAMFVAIPLGMGSAIYLSEYASSRTRKIIKPILEVLAGIPTVVYGYFALTFMTPVLKAILGNETVNFQNTASAGLVMGVMILPLVASMSEDALSAVPQALREAAFGLGSTKFETSVRVVVPAALSGIFAAFLLAISRAVGETMIVAIAAGSGSTFTFNPLEAAETMTGYIARISGGDTSYGTADYNSIFALGLTLFVVTLTLNILSRYLVNRFKEEYE
jgi:phosphate transport system permease protein